ncbi:sigma-54 dependent transcriptional regulator [Variovorax boronicumulans]|uniref:sigma-54 dependent transcriptional regulator n=1 Tax=Variovorax boronicumulans TaxID=436515 RepID=UPI001C56AD7D
MVARRLLCVAPGGRQQSLLETHLRAEAWEVSWAVDLATARRLQQRLDIGFCLLLLDRVDAALTDEIAALVAPGSEVQWIAVFPSRALELPSFQQLVLEAFFDYHTEPLDPSCLLQIMARAHRHACLRAACRSPVSAGAPDGLGMVGKSDTMAQLRRQIQKVAATEAPVLIGGESGSGKELAAQAIHRGSARFGGPFVAVNCGAIVPALAQSELFGHERGSFTGAMADRRGLIASAQGGTLFLDEIGDLPIELQTNLLRFLQEKTIQRVGATRSLAVDVRVVAASHVDLAEAVASGKFREDLYYRLHVLSITVPPLRERKEDVPILAQHFYRRCMAELSRTRVDGFSRQAIGAMLTHDWPGNVRELFNRVQRALVMTDSRLVSPADLELAGEEREAAGVGLDAARTLAERDAIRLTLDRVGRNVTHAARELGVSRMTLYRLMEKHHIGLSRAL